MSKPTLYTNDRYQLSKWRAEADALVLDGYGLGVSDLELMLRDFPLLDRSQPALPGEQRSTVTHDLLLLTAAEMLGEGSGTFRRQLAGRVSTAREIGAIPYIPSYLD